jgi:predicted regulator of Ras-like GTPase activity (Roadblock/LC7/MglB family)
MQKTEENLSRKLINLLQELTVQVPGILGLGIVGSDGLVIAQHSEKPDFDLEPAAAQFTLVMKLVQKTAKLLDELVEDDLIISPETLFLMMVLGDGTYWLMIAAQKNVARLGTVRFISSQYSERLWEAIPTQRFQLKSTYQFTRSKFKVQA